MKTIWKFELKVTDRQAILLPPNSEPLSVQVQKGAVCLWAMADDKAPATEPLKIRILGTGHPIIGSIGRHLGTFQLSGGDLVFHAFVDTAQ